MLAQDKHKEVRTKAQEALAAVHTYLDSSALQNQPAAVQEAVLRILQVRTITPSHSAHQHVDVDDACELNCNQSCLR